MGVVYEATQQDLGRRVALKVMHPGLAQSATAIERFRREAIAAAALSHPHIVQVTDLVQDGDGPAFLVMELLSGESLETAIQRDGPMSVERVLFITGQVLDALAAAHRAGIVHRDLKPANIFLTQLAGVADVVKLLDFGTAKLRETDQFAKLTQTGQLVGTPLFMAPEQARGDGVDARVDVYALGLVMHVALTARTPFPTHDPAALLKAIQDAAPEPISRTRPDVGGDLVALIEQATAKDPAKRFQTVEAMRGALSAMGGTRMRAEHAAQTSIHAQASRRRHAPDSSSRLMLWLALAALILLVAFGSVGTLVYLATHGEPALAAGANPATPANPALGSPSTPAVTPPTPDPVALSTGTPMSPTPLPSKLPSGRAAPGPTSRPSAQPPSHRHRTACTAALHLTPGQTYGLYSRDKVASELQTANGRAARCAARLPPGVASMPAMIMSVRADGSLGPLRFDGALPRGTAGAASCLRRAVSGFGLGPTENGLAGNVTVVAGARPASLHSSWCRA